jgi:hypothetical protein
VQAAENIGWFRADGGSIWGNMAEAPGKPFSRSGHRLARVLYIHYLSKVPFHPQPKSEERTMKLRSRHVPMYPH